MRDKINSKKSLLLSKKRGLISSALYGEEGLNYWRMLISDMPIDIRSRGSLLARLTNYGPK